MAERLIAQVANLENIKLLVLDVDGVLTDATLIINADGTESKSFNTLDGHGIRLWKRAGLKVAFLSGRAADATNHRAKQLDVDFCLQNCFDKLDALRKLLDRTGLSAENVAYVGDDLPDLPPLRYAGFGVAVADGVDELKKYADYVTAARAGRGAVREVIEYILKNTGRWQPLMQKYLRQ